MCSVIQSPHAQKCSLVVLLHPIPGACPLATVTVSSISGIILKMINKKQTPGDLSRLTFSTCRATPLQRMLQSSCFFLLVTIHFMGELWCLWCLSGIPERFESFFFFWYEDRFCTCHVHAQSFFTREHALTYTCRVT